MEHRKYIIFTEYTMQAYINLPTNSLKNEFIDAIKVYYEFLDYLLIVPTQCLNL